MNLSIPDAAAELAVSETRLRRTLLECAVPTLVEFRQTRTGVRKTTVLTAEAIAQLRAHFAAPMPRAAMPDPCAALHTETLDPAPEPQTAQTTDSCDAPKLMRTVMDFVKSPADANTDCSDAPAVAIPTQSVPVSQFNALLYQHNVLREELCRVTEYLDGCDRLLGEMVRTISTLEERTRQLEPAHAARPVATNPIAGALRSVSAGFQNALFTRAARKSWLKPADAYYGGALTGQS